MRKSTSIIGLGIILLLCILVYYPSLDNAFSNLDDQLQVVENRHIRSLSAENIKNIFTSTTVGMYQPLTSFLNAVVFHFAGLNPTAYHSLGLLLHLFNCILLFVLLKKFVKNDYVLLLLTGIFALHPMQVESVAWISAMSNLLFTSFYLLAFMAYLKYARTKQGKFYFLSLLLFILSCLSKVSAVSFPLLLLFYDWYESRKLQTSQLLRKIPFFIISIAFGIVAIIFREDAGHLSDLSQVFSLFERVFLISASILFYPLKLLFPFALSAFYPYPELIDGHLPTLYYLSLAALVFVLYLTIKNFKKYPLLGFGMGFYMICISLVIQIIPVGNQLTTDRYIYLPMIGLLLMLSVGLNKLLQWKKWTWVPISILLLALAFLSHKRSKVWQDDEILWKDVLSHYPHVAQAWNNLGNLYLEEGDAQKAYKHYNKAIELKPYYADAYSNRGVILSNLGKSQEAIRDFNRALQLRPHADAYFNLGNELAKIKDFNSAIDNFKLSIELEARPDAYANRAFAKLNLGKDESALQDLNTAIQLDPNFANAYFLKGMYYGQNNNIVEACKNLRKAAQLGHANAIQAVKGFCG